MIETPTGANQITKLGATSGAGKGWNFNLAYIIDNTRKYNINTTQNNRELKYIIQSHILWFIYIKFHAKSNTNNPTGGKNQIQIACLLSTFSDIVSINGTNTIVSTPITNQI